MKADRTADDQVINQIEDIYESIGNREKSEVEVVLNESAHQLLEAQAQNQGPFNVLKFQTE